MSKSPRRPVPPRRSPRLPEEVQLAIDAALDKKAVDPLVLDLRKGSAFTDFFVVCTGTSTRQVKAIAEAVDARLRAAGHRPTLVEGLERSEWVLLDFFHFIVHVFTPETRAFYDLERLWGDAERIEISA